MPQKFWHAGRKGKHLGWDDISAMNIEELLTHLKEWYGVKIYKVHRIKYNDIMSFEETHLEKIKRSK